MQVNSEKHRKQPETLYDFDETIVTQMAAKLGQQPQDVRRYLQEQNQFVCSIYKRMQEEAASEKKYSSAISGSDGNLSISAKGAI